MNLNELNPQITITSSKAAIAAFEKVYALPCSRFNDTMLDMEAIEALRVRNARWEWNFDRRLPFTVEHEDRLIWGGLQICLQNENDIVQGAKVYSDTMDWSVAPNVEVAPGAGGTFKLLPL